MYGGGSIPHQTQNQHFNSQQQYPYLYNQQSATQPSLHRGQSQSPSSVDHHINAYAPPPPVRVNHTGTWSTSGKGTSTMDMMTPLGGHGNPGGMNRSTGGYTPGTHQPSSTFGNSPRTVHEAMDTGLPSQELDSTPLRGVHRSS